MAKKSKMKLYSMDQIKDVFIGKRTTTKREKYEQALKMELLRGKRSENKSWQGFP